MVVVVGWWERIMMMLLLLLKMCQGNARHGSRGKHDGMETIFGPNAPTVGSNALRWDIKLKTRQAEREMPQQRWDRPFRMRLESHVVVLHKEGANESPRKRNESQNPQNFVYMPRMIFFGDKSSYQPSEGRRMNRIWLHRVWFSLVVVDDEDTPTNRRA